MGRARDDRALRETAKRITSRIQGTAHRDAARLRPAGDVRHYLAIGRLTVTTRSYNTAIVAQTNGAFPYGGLDLCRLSDADQRVAASIGGGGAANFGVAVQDAAGDKLVASVPVPPYAGSFEARGHRRPQGARRERALDQPLRAGPHRLHLEGHP